MKILESKILDCINNIISIFQDKLDILKRNSFLLSKIDYYILFSIILTYIASSFAKTETIGIISGFVPILVILKTFISKNEKIEIEHCNFYLLIYLLICLISNFTSSMISQSLYGYMKTLIYFAFYFALCQFLKNNKNYIIILLSAIALIIGFESIIGIFQSVIKVESISTWQDTSYVNPEDIISRVYGTLKPYNPNLFAGWLIAGVSSLIGICVLLFKSHKIAAGYCVLCLLLISMLTIFDTGCRGAYISLFIIILSIIISSFQIVFFDIQNNRLKKIWKSIILMLCIGMILFLLINHGILHRLMSIFIMREDSSTSFRINVYHSAIKMFIDNPIYGIGVGNKVFREIYGLYMLSGFDALSSYCIYLEMVVESGIFSLLSYLGFIIVLLSSAIKKFIISKEFTFKVLLIVSFISILSVMIHGIFDTIYFRPQVQYIFWTMTAILTVLVRENKTAEK